MPLGRGYAKINFMMYDVGLLRVDHEQGVIPMKIFLTTVQIPFITGGAEFLAKNLKDALIERGHETEIVTIPFMDSPPELIEDHILAARMLDVRAAWSGEADLCIGLKFPAYLMPHPNKVIWALHQHRSAYDLFDTEYSNLKDNEEGNYYRGVVKNADDCYLHESKRIYAISKNVVNRMMQYNKISATPLYPPCPDMDKFYCGEYNDYILMPSRINISKRQLLAIEALAQTKSNIKLYIVGKADHPFERERMMLLIQEKKLQDRVRYFDFVSQEEKFKLYAHAKAVLFIPIDEDYGYITLEAMSSSKMVITALDSGGPLEFIENGVNGYTVRPTAEGIAEAIDAVAASKAMAKEFGRKARRRIREMNITWDQVEKELTKP